MNYLFSLICISLALLAACQKPAVEPKFRCQRDQDIRREIFMECLRVVPQGPVATKYNDWSEVVSECGDQANGMSWRGCADTVAKDAHQDPGAKP